MFISRATRFLAIGTVGYVVLSTHGRVFLVNRYGTSDLGDDRLAALIWHATTPEKQTSAGRASV